MNAYTCQNSPTVHLDSSILLYVLQIKKEMIGKLRNVTGRLRNVYEISKQNSWIPLYQHQIVRKHNFIKALYNAIKI